MCRSIRSLLVVVVAAGAAGCASEDDPSDGAGRPALSDDRTVTIR